MTIVEEVFRGIFIKKYGTDENFDIIVNAEKGDLEIWKNRTIVDDGGVEDADFEIQLSDALKVEPDFEIGEDFPEQVFMKDFDRRSILTLKQNLASKLKNMIIILFVKNILRELVK